MSEPTELTEEDLRALQKLREAEAEYDKIADRDRIPVHDPDKFAAPIGVDDDGRPFPVKP